MNPSFTNVARLTNIDPDNVYYNMSMVNGNLSGGGENDPQIRFYESRDRPILRDASKYEMSVIKFNVNGASKNLPILVPQLAPAMSATASQTTTTVTVTTSIGHGLRTTATALTRITLGSPTSGSEVDGVYAITVTGFNTFTFTSSVSQTATWATAVPNAVYSYEKTCYTLTMSRAVATPTFISSPVYWVPETDAPLIASAPNTMDLTNEYFYVYHYAHWLQQVNACINRLTLSLGFLTSAPASTGSGVAGLTLATLTNVATASALLYVGMPVVLTGGLTGSGYIASITSANTVTVASTVAFGGGTGATTITPQVYTSGATAANFVGFPATGSSAWTGTATPRLKYAYNPVTILFSLYANVLFFGFTAPTATNACTFYYNTNFESLFTGFHNQYTQANTNFESQLNFPQSAIQNTSDGQLNTWFIPTSYPNNSSTLDWVITQESNSTTSLWCPVDAIVFTSTNIPIRNEEGSTPVRAGNTTIGVPFGGNGSFGSIISELTLDQHSASDWRGFLYYQPYAQYQIGSLDGSDVEIRSIDIYAWWRSRLNGQLIPLRLYNNGSASMKLLFRKRK